MLTRLRGFDWTRLAHPVLLLADTIAHPATRAALSVAALAVVVGLNLAPVPSEPLTFEGTRPATAGESAQHDIDHLRDLLTAQMDRYREAAQ